MSKYTIHHLDSGEYYISSDDGFTEAYCATERIAREFMCSALMRSFLEDLAIDDWLRLPSDVVVRIGRILSDLKCDENKKDLTGMVGMVGIPEQEE